LIINNLNEFLFYFKCKILKKTIINAFFCNSISVKFGLILIFKNFSEMKALPKKILCGLFVLLNMATFAQKNQAPVIVNNCNSGYATTLLLENQIALDSNTGAISAAAPLFTLDIKNSWGNSVSISDLSYSFKITNYNSGQAIDFENFDYLNDAYITDDFVINRIGNTYDVEFLNSNYSTGSTNLIDDRSGLVVSDVLEKFWELFRSGDLESDQNEIGYTIEISNVRFKKAGTNFFEFCATNFTKTVIIELEGSQKTSQYAGTSLFKKNTANLMHCFPNPAKEKVYIYLNGFENDIRNYDVLIYNMNGQIMLSQKWNPYKAIELAHLSEGMYNLFILDKFRQIKHSNKLIIE